MTKTTGKLATRPNAADWRNRAERAEQALAEAERELDLERRVSDVLQNRLSAHAKLLNDIQQQMERQYACLSRAAIREVEQRDRLVLLGSIAAFIASLIGFAAGLSYAAV